MEENKPNGHGVGERPNGLHKVTLTLDPLTFKLHMDVDEANWDRVMATLQQAQRFVEGQLRAAQALQLRAAMQEQEQNAAIAAALRKR